MSNIIVSKNSDCYNTIQSAIDFAKPNSIILITAGIYIENIVIKKPLTLQPVNETDDVIIVILQKPTIYISVPCDQKVIIKGLKISHSGKNESIYQNNSKLNMQQLIDKAQYTQNFKDMDPQDEFINYYNLTPNLNSCIYLESGILDISKSLITLNFIAKGHTSLITGLIACEGSQLIMKNCEIKGNQNHDTIGLILKWADVYMEENLINYHQNGGLITQGHQFNEIEIKSSRFEDNCLFGMHVIGENCNQKLIQNQILNTNGTGVVVGIGNKCKLFRNLISKNNIGIELISCQAMIYQNQINYNRQNGIVSCAIENFINVSTIQRNEVAANGNIGIECTGQKNLTKISDNPFIALNKSQGIRVDKEAEITIVKNYIARNFEQGILIVESACAIIDGNYIFQNIKSNIALGGQNSVNTIIVENKIQGGQFEGIYMVESGETWVIRNEILENHEGLVCSNSCSLIQQNKIHKNIGNGIMLMKESCPTIKNNIIQENDGVGLYIMDLSSGDIQDNKIVNNEIEYYQEKYIEKLENIIENNAINGDIRSKSKVDCNIF